MALVDTQYQHFIPQFILKRFSHPFVCPETPENKLKCKKKHHERYKYPGDEVVNCLRLSPDGFTVDEHPTRRICGIEDMYTDKKETTQLPRLLEIKFSALEGQASRIIRKIVTEHQACKDSVTLMRTERDILRKFLFLLMYRGPGHYRRFDHESIDDCHPSDQPILKEYMDKHNLQRPIDAWLHSLSAIIDLHMDLGDEWAKQVYRSVYYCIATDFVDHVTNYWIAICTPASEDQEFILTDTGYNVHEGPTVHYRDRETGEHAALGPSFHYFTTIAPRLVIVMRSRYLPEPFEDANPELKSERGFLRKIMTDALFGKGTKSILEDMPVHKAFNNYSSIINGRVTPRPGWDGKLRPNDEFSFPFFKVNTDQMRIINGLLLDHAFHGSIIVFDRKAVFLNLLQWYLEEPCEVGKNLIGEHHDAKKEYITQLAYFMENEGRKVKTNITSWPGEHSINLKRLREIGMEGARWAEEFSQERNNETEGDHKGAADKGSNVQEYHDRRVNPELVPTSQEWHNETVTDGAKDDSFSGVPAEALRASLIMLQVWVRKAELDFKDAFPTSNRLQVLLSDYQDRQPIARFWLFLKQFRYAIWESDRNANGQKHDPRSWDEASPGPEDDVTKSAMPTTKQSEANAMMWESFITDIRKTRTPDPDFNLAELTAFLLRVGGEVYTKMSPIQ
ncbi:hypothetical protein FPOAC1_003862 [Fusarium poae]|uniref:hypothetical protein n=1 Tax=Fusarium poae TaxID=36050 RepID=UPI001CE80844|nr:hypothetical protein FPOAC1_003862 [Fusarium poae]KAG8677834.1 hypothetical protein FPOAC1_003862 [Fusarium poae]